MASKFITNFVGGTTKSQWAKLGTGYTQNMYLETKDSNEHYFSRVLLPFPGHEHLMDVTGDPRGLYTAVGGYYGETVYLVAGNYLYCRVDSGLVKLGEVGSGEICFAELRTADKNFLLVSDESSLFAIDMTDSPHIQKMVNIPLPERVNSDGSYGNHIEPTSVCVCYSMINVVDKGTDKFYTSVTLPFKLTDGAIDWDAFAVSEQPLEDAERYRPYYRVGYYTYAETSADPIVKLVSTGTRLYCIGKKSFDVFDYTGVAISKSLTAGVVWKCPRGNGGLYGTEDGSSVQVLGGKAYYVARNPDGGKSIVALGDSISMVSTPEIEFILDNDYVAGALKFQWGQHPFYVLRLNDSTLAYDVVEEVWVNLSTDGGAWDIVDATPFGNSVYLQYNGGIGRFTTDKWTDHNGHPIVRTRRGIVTNSNYDEFTIDKVSVVTNSGQYGESAGECRAIFRWTTDGSTWEDTGLETLGRAGQYDRVLDVYDLGIGRVFSIEISCSEDIPFCVYGITVDAQMCNL